VTPSRSARAEKIYLGLVADYQAAILNYLYRLVGDVEAAEDLTQDTFVKAWRALERMEIDPESEPRRRAWLYRIAHNSGLAHLRRRSRLRWVSLSALHRGSGDPAEKVEAAEPARAVLERLPADQRELLDLFLVEGLSAEEVGEILGISPEAARKRRQRATEAFRSMYSSLAANVELR
jgi:RNA polymerase sigma-70 factor (ECF subfamily)